MMGYPIGYGLTERSPDGKFVASATEFEDMTFWGARPHYTVFELRDRDGTVINRLRTEPFLWYDGYPAPMRGEKPTARVIKWDSNSSSVHFVFQDKEITMAVAN